MSIIFVMIISRSKCTGTLDEFTWLHSFNLLDHFSFYRAALQPETQRSQVLGCPGAADAMFVTTDSMAKLYDQFS